MPGLTPHTSGSARSRQRGAATLIVVMVLFFIMSLVAAYAGRNLLFEQRTSVNQYRSTQALEAAQAGLEWALTRLNASRVDAACVPTADVGQNTFRDRYLAFNAATGVYTARLQPNNQPLLPSCVRNAAGNLVCDCPAAAAPVVAAPAGTGSFPAFRVQFTNLGQPGVIQARVVGCTRYDENCLNPALGSPQSGDGRAVVVATFGMKPALPTPPAAAVTAGGNVNLGGAALRAVYADSGGSGLAIHARGAVNMAGLIVQGSAGTPASQLVLDNDLGLQASADRRFVDQFGMWRQTWREHPAVIRLTCPADCTAANLQALASAQPGRPLWLQGNASIDVALDIGTAADPVLLVVDGDLDFTVAPIRIYGVVYNQSADWTTVGSALIQGALVAEGNLVGAGTPDVVYDRAIVERIRQTYGSFVMVPGSWRDF